MFGQVKQFVILELQLTHNEFPLHDKLINS